MPWFRKALTLDPACAVAQSNLLFALNYDTTLSAEEIFAEHCVFGRVQENIAPPPRPHAHEIDLHRRLRIGYVSPDFRSHALMRFFLPLLAHHDSVKVEITCYAEVPRPDAVSQRCRTMAHRWRSTCGLSDKQMADTIRADAIDILIDLAGHTAGNRLPVFTHRPAPVQATYLGYPNTTGLRSIDYLITDRLRHPPGEAELCTEEVFRLDDFNCCFQAPVTAPPVNPLPLARTGRLTFGSLHNLTKLNDAVLDLWCRALRAVPSARLLLFRDTLTGELREQMRRRLLERGIADERLDLRHGHAADGYLGVYHDIDVSLDVSPWGAGTTVYESAWMGVPMLTLRGKRFTDRASTAVLTCVGLPEMIADDADDFVERARWLAVNADWLARMCAELRGRMNATICDAAGFTRRLEAAYRVMWQRRLSEPRP